MSRNKQYPIDPDKLRKLFKRSKLAVDRVSEEMGYASTYFYNSFKRKSISSQAKELLNMKYGIEYDEYKPVEENFAVEELTSGTCIVIDYDKLEECIVRAINRAQFINGGF